MKAWKAVAVVLLGMALAAPVWGTATIRFNVDPANPLRCEISYSIPAHTAEWWESRIVGMTASYTHTSETRCSFNHAGEDDELTLEGEVVGYDYRNRTSAYIHITQATRSGIIACGAASCRSGTYKFHAGEFAGWETEHRAQIGTRKANSGWIGYVGATHTTPSKPATPPPEPEPETPTPPTPPPEPEPPEPEPPAPPPEPEPPAPPPEPEPEPPAPPPEPEEPDPEEPDHTHPVERCDHIAIVPAMPRALSGDEGSPDHWLRISNLGAASITFAITGLDEGGTKAGTYRRELPASRIVRVKMRDVEAAFDVEPEGWWRLVVTGSGPLEVVATMRQGAERRFVPVRTPATCGTGPVTRIGG